MRMFVAVRPPQAVVEHLDRALDPVRAAAGRSLRFSDPEQWHLTLAFHPDVPWGAFDDVLEDATALAGEHAPMDLHLSGAGAFSGRTLWIGVGGDTCALRDVLTEPWLPEPERDRRRAHLTVARISQRAPERGGRRNRSRRHGDGRRGASPLEADGPDIVAQAVRALSVYRGPSWHVDEVELVTSRLGEGRSGGPLHEVLATIPLGGRPQ